MHILYALKVLFGHLPSSTAVTPWRWSLKASITASDGGCRTGVPIPGRLVIAGVDLLKDHPKMKAATSAMAT